MNEMFRISKSGKGITFLQKNVTTKGKKYILFKFASLWVSKYLPSITRGTNAHIAARLQSFIRPLNKLKYVCSHSHVKWFLHNNCLHRDDHWSNMIKIGSGHVLRYIPYYWFKSQKYFMETRSKRSSTDSRHCPPPHAI